MKMNKKAAALGGLAALVAVGGTWAYFNQTAAITNPFHTEGGYETSVIEHFNPSDGEDWKPGVTVNKEVIASNTGDADVLVRVAMDEVWRRGDEDLKLLTSRYGTVFTTVEQEDAEDGLVERDKTVVGKELNETDWTFNNEDGYWYYNTRLAAKTDSESLLKSVTLASDLDMGKYKEVFAYCVTDGENDPLTDWKSVETEEELKAAGAEAKAEGKYFHVKKGKELDPTLQGYADANYDLTITIEFVQPTEDAVTEAWGSIGFDQVKDLVDGAQPIA